MKLGSISYELIIYKNLGVNVYLFFYLDFHGFLTPETPLYGMNIVVAFQGKLTTAPSD
jgi:hypothetical protein